MRQIEFLKEKIPVGGRYKETGPIPPSNTEDLYTTLANKALCGVYIVQNGVFQYINPISAQTTGYSEVELIGEPPSMLVHPDDRTRVQHNARIMLKDGGSSSTPFRILTKHGEVRWVIETVAPICYLGADAALGTVMDITERVQTEDQLRESEQRLSNIIDFLPEATFVIDRTGRVIAWNRAMEEMTGAPKDQVIGTTDYHRLLPTCDQRRAPLIDLAIKPDVNFESRYPYVRNQQNALMTETRTVYSEKRGKQFFSATAAPIFDTRGELVGAIESIRDITAKKRTEEALQIREEKYRNIFENAVDGMFQCTLRGRFISINSSLADIFGYDSPEDMIHSVTDINKQLHVRGRDRQKILKMLDESGIIRNLEMQSFRKDKSIIWISLNARAVRNAQGKILYLEGTVKDITGPKRMEAQLLQAQKMEAIGTLAGGIAHDFNNLLMGIQGYTSLMLYSMESSHPHYLKLKAIEDQVKCGAGLARQMLGFAQAGSYEVQTIDLREIIHKTADMFGRTKKEIRIHKAFQDNLWPVEADPRQLEQALINLYVNAWQAMPAGGDLYLELSNVEMAEGYTNSFNIKPGQYAKLSVTDTGVGMDEKTRLRVFEPFFTTREMGRGTGLGLAATYGIIKGHGGIINVYSEQGHGTTFNIYLPATFSERETAITQPARTLQGGNETILLVDDEECVMDIVRDILVTLGYTVLTANNGQCALDIYSRSKKEIDLVIFDMIMPEMCGEELFDALKTSNPAVKAILTSGYSANGQSDRILHRGCAAFIQKPFDISDISRKVREILDR